MLIFILFFKVWYGNDLVSKDGSPIRNINQFNQLYDLPSSLSSLGSVIKVGSHFGAWNQNSQQPFCDRPWLFSFGFSTSKGDVCDAAAASADSTIHTRLPLSSFLQLSILAFRPKFFRHWNLNNYKENLRYVSRRSCNKNPRNTWRKLKLKLEQTRWSSHKLQNQKLQIQQVENAICVRAFKWWVKKNVSM